MASLSLWERYASYLLPLLIVFVDYVMQFMKVFNIDIEEQKEKIEERVKAFASRWS